MEESELRIGNCIQYNGVICIVEGIKKGVLYSQGDTYCLKRFQPILLTKEWLIKLGFKKYEWTDAYFVKLGNKHLMIQFFKDDTFTFFTKISKDSGGQKMKGRDYFLHDLKVKYVHQLQNIYFALKGKELILKQ